MKSPISSKLTTKCQATIPEKIRGILGLHPGDSVAFEVTPGKKVFIRKATPIDFDFIHAFERQLNANITHDTRGQLHNIQTPTLILAGKDDDLTPPGMAEELHSDMPHSKLLIFEQGGHGLYWEVPELFNESVINFIKQHDDLH